jgi:outer membrane lipoprotein-sorting protein
VRSFHLIFGRLLRALRLRLPGRWVRCGVVALCAGLTGSLGTAADAGSPLEPRVLIEKMETAYRQVSDYRTQLVITGFGKDSSFTSTQKLLYTFKKPNKLRLDFETPHRGMTIIYPDRDGKVWIRPNFWFPFINLHLEPSNANLEISPGQQINQSDLGMLIRNITHSLTDCYLGELQVAEDREQIIIRVLADNPFRRGKATRYVFFINRDTWLPVAVEESSPTGELQRTVAYQHLQLNTGVANSFFQMD